MECIFILFIKYNNLGRGAWLTYTTPCESARLPRPCIVGNANEPRQYDQD